MPDEPVMLRVSRAFHVPPERVFAAWLDPGMLRRWMWTQTPEQVRSVAVDARVGGGFTILERRDGLDVTVVGRYVELDPPRRLVVDIAVPHLSTAWDRVTVELAPAALGCELGLTHENLAPEYVESVAQGWAGMFAALAAAVEGEEVPAP